MRTIVLLAATALLMSGCGAHAASSSTSQTAGTQPAGATSSAAPAGDRCASSAYLRVVGCHLQAASTLNQAINQACSNYLAPQCASTIEQYEGELLAAQRDLPSATVPAALTQANRSLLAAISADQTASRQALDAISARNLSGFLGAVSTHIQAGSLLTRAWSQALKAVGG